jgi:photosystem II stability/assembly factor-like uncharacterized protein
MRLRPGLTSSAFCTILILGACRPVSGLHWKRADAGLPRQAAVLALVSDPSDPNWLWAGYYAPGGLVASPDGGQSWRSDAQGLNDNPVFDLLSFPGGLLWAATRDGLLKSTDGGKYWVKVVSDLPSAAVFALAADGSGRVYVGLDGAGLYIYQPGQERWTSLNNHPQLITATILSLAVSSTGTHLYAGTAGRGLFASQDAGQTWVDGLSDNYATNLALSPTRPRTAVASLRDYLVRTQDGGQTWEELVDIPWTGDEVTSLLWVAETPQGDSETLWAGSGQGRVYCSLNGGDSWAGIEARLPAPGGVLALLMTNDQPPRGGPQRLLAGAWSGIYASPVPQACSRQRTNIGPSNSRRAWSYLSPSVGVPYANTLLRTDTGLLIGTRAGLFRWQPTVRNWTRVSTERPKGAKHVETAEYQYPGGVDYLQGTELWIEGITSLAAAPSDAQVVYAGTATGRLYRSDDGGASWSRVLSDLEVGFRALVIAPDDVDRIYTLAAWERVYESNNGGRSWQARWTGLGVTSEAISLELDASDSSTLYVGTDTGLYRSDHGGMDWKPVGRPLDHQTVLTLLVNSAGNATGSSSTLYMGATRGAYLSHDGGTTVRLWGHGLQEVSVTALLFDYTDARTIYAGTAYAGLFRSVDKGETWQPTGPPELVNEVIGAMAWGPAGELFVASAGGVWMGSKE